MQPAIGSNFCWWWEVVVAHQWINHIPVAPIGQKGEGGREVGGMGAGRGGREAEWELEGGGSGSSRAIDIPLPNLAPPSCMHSDLQQWSCWSGSRKTHSCAEGYKGNIVSTLYLMSKFHFQKLYKTSMLSNIHMPFKIQYDEYLLFYELRQYDFFKRILFLLILVMQNNQLVLTCAS